MPKNIFIYLKIPINDSFSGPHMYFHRWIPAETNPIIAYKDQFKIKLQIDRDCVPSPDHCPETERWSNITIDKVKVEIRIQDVSDELATFIYNERENRSDVHHGVKLGDQQYDDLNNEFKELGLKALEFTYEVCNNLISYVRNQKGQYWLEPISFDKKNLRSLYAHLGAKAKIEDGDLFRWSPSSINMISVDNLDLEFIAKDSWIEAQDFVKTRKKVNLVKELLSNSLSFLQQERARSAVIEATTALEIAMSRFSIKPNLDKLEFPTSTRRIEIENLKTHVDQFGFAKSIGYLLPILFKEKELSTKLIDKCNKAITSRNAIVHQGDGIDLVTAEKHILSLKQCSEILMEYTI